ncbi:MAG: hypothetical protein HUJ31_16765 [Pseudomonadales bacterium]|nr:hypothetical protein [Pseudomonadales bacterium]
MRVRVPSPSFRFGKSPEYLARATFDLKEDRRGGTDLEPEHTGQQGKDWHESHAGWLNVLLPLKALLAYGVDLRNGDPERTWDRGYVDG